MNGFFFVVVTEKVIYFRNTEDVPQWPTGSFVIHPPPPNSAPVTTLSLLPFEVPLFLSRHPPAPFDRLLAISPPLLPPTLSFIFNHPLAPFESPRCYLAASSITLQLHYRRPPSLFNLPAYHPLLHFRIEFKIWEIYIYFEMRNEGGKFDTLQMCSSLNSLSRFTAIFKCGALEWVNESLARRPNWWPFPE